MSDPASIGSIAVVDVETTGLFPARHDRIVEIAMVVVKADGFVVKEFESLVNPMRDVGPTSVHGLTSDDLLYAPKFEDIAGHVLDVLQGTIALAGHNVRFDYQFLASEFKRVGMEFPTCHLVCTMEMAGGGSLDDCCRCYGVSLDGERHSAMFDALCANRLFAMLAQDNPRLASRLIALKPLQFPRYDGMRNPPLSRRMNRPGFPGEFRV